MYIRSRITLKNYHTALNIVGVLFVIIAIVIALINGISSQFNYVIIIITILFVTIVYSPKTAKIVAIFVFILYGLISLLHQTKIIPYSPVPTSSDPILVIIFLGLIWTIINISSLGFNQIEEYYKSAISYSNELDQLNRDLDKRVKERTAILQENFNKQVKDMYNSATIGNITKPLLHDLGTPVSSLSGGLDMLKQSKQLDSELVETMELSLGQIRTILEESRDLMRNVENIEAFEVNESIKKVLKIVQNELRKFDIKLTFNNDDKLIIDGIVSIFSRILINLLINAVEELKNKNSDRTIDVNVLRDKNHIVIEVRDNGRGIPASLVDTIFSEEFSSKSSTHNLGLGLPFVKKMMKEVFEGNIVCESLPGEYTKFILYFNPK